MNLDWYVNYFYVVDIFIIELREAIDRAVERSTAKVFAF